MEITLKSLVAKRGGIKAQLTLFETFIGETQSGDITKTNLILLQKRLNKIEPLLESYIEIDTEITCLQETEANIDELRSFQDKYFRLITRAYEIISAQPHEKESNELV